MFEEKGEPTRVVYEARIEQFTTKPDKDGGCIGKIVVAVHSRNPMLDFADLLKLQMLFCNVTIEGSRVTVKELD